MSNKNEQKNFLDKFYSSMMGGIFKVFTNNMKELYHEFLNPQGVSFGEKPSLESKTENFKQNSPAFLERPYKSNGHLEDFRNHESINPSKAHQKNNYFQKNNVFLVYSANFGI